MKLETENRKRPKETKASSSWERTGPRRAPRSRGRVAAAQGASPRSLRPLRRRVLVLGSSRSCFGGSRRAPCSSPETRRLRQRPAGPAGRWRRASPVPFLGGKHGAVSRRPPWDHGVTGGRVPRLESGLEREQSRPGMAGAPAEARPPVLGSHTPVTVTVGAAGRVGCAPGTQSADRVTA